MVPHPSQHSYVVISGHFRHLRDISALQPLSGTLVQWSASSPLEIRYKISKGFQSRRRAFAPCIFNIFQRHTSNKKALATTTHGVVFMFLTCCFKFTGVGFRFSQAESQLYKMSDNNKTIRSSYNISSVPNKANTVKRQILGMVCRNTWKYSNY